MGEVELSPQVVSSRLAMPESVHIPGRPAYRAPSDSNDNTLLPGQTGGVWNIPRDGVNSV